MKILFIVPYPTGKAASQRFRFEQYFDLLRSKKIHFDIAPFLNQEAFQFLYQPGNILKKTLAIVHGFIKRFILLFGIKQYDYVFIHREAAPLGPPVIEWIIIKLLGKKTIYDFDDAIWLPNVSESNKWISKLKWHSKVRKICQWAYKISCGNEYLFDYARKFNSSVVLNHTTIDTDNLHNKLKDQQTEKFVVGWTGTHSTIKYLDLVIPALEQLEAEIDFELCIISDQRPSINLSSIHYIPWNKHTEIEDLLNFNIGLMPLTDEIWSRGKCGFKALQYMSLGIPALVSPVAINKKIVDDNINGFYCNTVDDWIEKIKLLSANPEMRAQMGESARKKVLDCFSVTSNSSTFLSLFT